MSKLDCIRNIRKGDLLHTCYNQELLVLTEIVQANEVNLDPGEWLVKVQPKENGLEKSAPYYFCLWYDRDGWFAQEIDKIIKAPKDAV